MERGWHRGVTTRERLGARKVHWGRAALEGPSPGSGGDGRLGWAFEGGTVGRVCGKVAGEGVIESGGVQMRQALGGTGVWL